MTQADVLVIGGGPAGATVAGLLAKYRPEARVTLLERDTFPRFHVGETFVSEINRILAELGVYDAVDAAGFVRKYGATFRWGSDVATWNLTFGELEPLRPQEEKIDAVQTAYTWHVDRAVYDDLLLRHAASLGVEVRHHVEVTDLLHDADGRVCGVRLADGETMTARFVVDATGQSGLLGSSRDRELDPRLRNIAYWAYYEDVDLVPEWCGGRERSRAFICAHGFGWTWVFPIDDRRVSVGVVTTAEAHASRANRDPEAFFREALDTSPELRHILRDARLVPYAPGMPRVHRIADFSYISRTIVQPGLIRTGDAAGFVDPILSVGAFLGQTSARHLAYSLATLLDPACRLDEDTVLRAYADQTADTLAAFRELTYFFYRFNERHDAWWQHARDLVAHAGLPKAATDKQAFAIFASGFAARRSVFREPTQVFDEPFFHDAFRRLVEPGAVLPSPPRAAHSTDVLRLIGEPTLTASAVPLDGRGRVVPALRVAFPAHDAGGGDRLGRRILVPPSMAALFPLVDGQTTVAELGERMRLALGVAEGQRADVHRYVRVVLAGLLERGLAEPVPPTAARATA